MLSVMTSEIVDLRLRRFLLMLTGFIFLGTIGELILEEHTKETLQFVPFVLCIIGFISVAVALVRPQRSTVLALRVTMIVVALGGLLGMAIHILNNFEFEQEIRPNAEISEILINTLKGANPLLAPGILAFAAIVALLATYYHPTLGSPDTP
jgi:hypothetical protein